MGDGSGLFIVLEGADGSGKTTQFNLLAERLKAMGFEIEVFDFPRYDHPSSHFVRQYLNGAYGPASSVSPYTASLFYALDRYEAAPAIRSALKENKIVLSNRFVGSNMAHQGSKFKNPVEQRGFFIWEDGLEFNLLNIPRPTINIYLRVPAETSFKLIGEKAARSYTSKTHDEHEADIEHLRQSVATYDLLTQLFPKDFTAIECTKEGELLSVPEINNMIWEVLRPLLPEQRNHSGRGSIVQLNRLGIPPHSAPPEGPSTKQPSEGKTASSHGGRLDLSLDNISLLAATRILGTADIQAEITIKTNENNRAYYNLGKADKNLKRRYLEALNMQHEIYSRAKESLNQLPAAERKKAAEAFTHALPLASLTSLAINGSIDGIKSLIGQLGRSQLSELRWIANQLLESSKKLQPDSFRDFHLPKNEEEHDFLSLYLGGSMSSRGSDSSLPVRLLAAWPRNEFGVLADSVYPQTDLPRNEVMAEIESWPYEDKLKALQKGASLTDSFVFDHVKYRWDVISDYQTIEPLIEKQIASEMRSQAATVRYGYDIPEIIEEHKLDELYMGCFDSSLALFSEFQTVSDELASYLVLAGHKRRWLFTTSYSGLTFAHKTATGSTKKLLIAMTEQLSEAHPVLSEVITKNRADDQIQNRTRRQTKLGKSRAKRGRD